jgi:hypoxanthine-DNA glycosylase
MKAGLPPILDLETQVLICGSFPSEESLARQQYYANRRNQFWKLLDIALGANLSGALYPQRLEQLRARKVGIWDVLNRCDRTGSLDSSIRCSEVNDFDCLRILAPSLRLVLLNGKEAGSYAPILMAVGYETIILPSSSSTNTHRTLEGKAKEWRAALLACDGTGSGQEPSPLYSGERAG